MCLDDYHHYNDWKDEMQKTYDQFNMLQLPQNKNEIKLYFNEATHKRRVPHGIFPHPHFKRTVLQHNAVENLQVNELYDKSDRYAKFEKDPMKFMRENELKKMKELREITPDVSMMCNLQNIKQGLKSDFDDKQLSDLMFNKLEFTELIIKDHLE